MLTPADNRNYKWQQETDEVIESFQKLDPNYTLKVLVTMTFITRG